MKIYELKDETGRIFAFEVSNFGRYRACRLVSKIPGVNVLKRQKYFQFSSDDEFCKFELNGKRFVLFEPWGDSSRFWIGTDSANWCPEVDEVRKAFSSYKPLWLF